MYLMTNTLACPHIPNINRWNGISSRLQFSTQSLQMLRWNIKVHHFCICYTVTKNRTNLWHKHPVWISVCETVIGALQFQGANALAWHLLLFFSLMMYLSAYKWTSVEFAKHGQMSVDGMGRLKRDILLVNQSLVASNSWTCKNI